MLKLIPARANEKHNVNFSVTQTRRRVNNDATASNVNFTSIGALFSFYPEVNSRLVEHVGATPEIIALIL